MTYPKQIFPVNRFSEKSFPVLFRSVDIFSTGNLKKGVFR